MNDFNGIIVVVVLLIEVDVCGVLGDKKVCSVWVG